MWSEAAADVAACLWAEGCDCDDHVIVGNKPRVALCRNGAILSSVLCGTFLDAFGGKAPLWPTAARCAVKEEHWARAAVLWTMATLLAEGDAVSASTASAAKRHDTMWTAWTSGSPIVQWLLALETSAADMTTLCNAVFKMGRAAYLAHDEACAAAVASDAARRWFAVPANSQWLLAQWAGAGSGAGAGAGVPALKKSVRLAAASPLALGAALGAAPAGDAFGNGQLGKRKTAEHGVRTAASATAKCATEVTSTKRARGGQTGTTSGSADGAAVVGSTIENSANGAARGHVGATVASVSGAIEAVVGGTAGSTTGRATVGAAASAVGSGATGSGALGSNAKKGGEAGGAAGDVEGGSAPGKAMSSSAKGGGAVGGVVGGSGAASGSGAAGGYAGLYGADGALAILTAVAASAAVPSSAVAVSSSAAATQAAAASSARRVAPASTPTGKSRSVVPFIVPCRELTCVSYSSHLPRRRSYHCTHRCRHRRGQCARRPLCADQQSAVE